MRTPSLRTLALPAGLVAAACLPAAGGASPQSSPTLHQLGAKLTSPISGSIGQFGMGAAVSRDGSTALIGAPGSNAAWIYTRSGSTWTQAAELTPIGAVVPAEFGTSVALSQNGSTAVVGGPYDNRQQGAVWVFVRSGSSWVLQGSKLTGAGETGAGQFGASVAVSSNGGLLLVGGPTDNGSVGGAWVFVRNNHTWAPRGGELTGAGESGAGKFGSAVALSGTGAVALVAGDADNGNVGAVWPFTISASRWSAQGGKLTSTGGHPTHGLFGASVALGGNGNVGLIGSPGEMAGRPTPAATGAAYVFTRSAGAWTQSARFVGSDEVGQADLGAAVALSTSGAEALVGGIGDGPEPGGIGAAWVFTGSGSTWTQQGSKLTVSDETGTGFFGSSVSLSGNGGNALIAAHADAHGAGAAWFFTTTAGASAPATAPKALAVTWDEDAEDYEGQVGKTVSFSCPAAGTASDVWGSGPFTDDSSVCTAAVFSGLITFAKGGTVTFTMGGSTAGLTGSSKNGVTTQQYGSWPSTFTFVTS